MTYQWKLPGVMPVDAQTAGDELERVYKKRGDIKPSTLVEESRPASAPLHRCFEWDDAIAAEKYRESQASYPLRLLLHIARARQLTLRTRVLLL